MANDSERSGPDEPELPLESQSDTASAGEERDSVGKWVRGRRPPTMFEFADPPQVGEPEGSTAGGQDEALAAAGEGGTAPSGVEPSPRRTPRGRPELEPLFQKAKAATASGQLREAEETYRRIVSADPGHVRARNNLGVLLDQGGGHKAALEHFQAAVDLEPDNAELLTNFGAALAAEGRYDEAEVQLRKAARLDPGGVDVRANLGILYFRRGLYTQCEQELRWVCDESPDHGLAHFYRGEALNRLGRVDEALETLERALHLQPGKARIYYLLGILYDKKNLPQEAATMYRKARELNDS